MDETQLVTALVAGATIAGVELVKETTKDAYRGLKQVVSKVFGTRAERAIEKVEAAPGDSVARQDLVKLLPSLSSEERSEIQPAITAFLQALEFDDAAKPVMAAARIRLDIKAGGNITLQYLEGATDIDVKANAGQDFTLSGVRMQEPERGN
jgi:hypothetical protein